MVVEDSTAGNLHQEALDRLGKISWRTEVVWTHPVFGEGCAAEDEGARRESNSGAAFKIFDTMGPDLPRATDRSPGGSTCGSREIAGQLFIGATQWTITFARYSKSSVSPPGATSPGCFSKTRAGRCRRP